MPIDGIEVLLVEDRVDESDTVGELRSTGDMSVTATSSISGALEIIESNTIDCVISEYEVADEEGVLYLGGLKLLKRVRKEYPELPFILFTDIGNEEVARETIAADVTDLINRETHPRPNQRLVRQIRISVEHRRAEKRAKRQARINEVIRDVNNALVRVTDREGIERDVCTLLAQSNPYLFAWMAEFDGEDVVPRSAAEVEGPVALPFVEGEHDDDSPVRRAGNEGAIATVADLEEDDRDWGPAIERGFRSVAAIPVGYQNVLYGVLVLYAARSHVFDDVECAVLEELGDTIGYAITAAENRQELRRRDRRLEALQETTRKLLRAEEYESIGSIVVTAVREVLEFPVAAMWRYEEGTGRLEPLASVGLDRELGTVDPGSGVVWESYDDGEVVFQDDVPTGMSVDAGNYSTLLVPIGEHGVLAAGSQSSDVNDAATLDLELILAATVEAALERTDREQLLRKQEAALARKNERLEEFASVVSHDLRNPLNVAQGYVALLDEDTDAVQAINESHERMEEIIQDVLTLAREGYDAGEVTEVNVTDVTREAWENVDTGASTLSVSLSDVGTIEANRSQLLQLFENLFRNAVEHGADHAVELESPRPSSETPPSETPPEAAGVAVTVGATDSGFYVADDGPGIAPDDRETVFDMGFTTDQDGTGFGLAIVKRIAQIQGWSVSVTDSEAGGARFEFTDVY